jgi:hypothetical protein
MQHEGTIHWRKSSYSPHNDNCVEVGLTPDVIGIRDTKDRAGGHLVVTPARWQAFLDAVKANRLDR